MRSQKSSVLTLDIADLHEPVLLQEVLEFLSPEPGGVIVDATLGMGGHSQAILERFPEIAHLIGMDRDADALALASERLSPWREKITFFHANFSDLSDLVQAERLGPVDGVLMDLGISSFQIEKSGRGFSFRKDEPLDMRMNSSTSITAADLVNQLPEEKLQEILLYYGEERWAAKIAAAIGKIRKESPIITSRQLASLVEQAIPRRFHPKRIHPATKTFQAIRIAVNREFENLKKALTEIPEILKAGARFLVISFHSIEDRMIKQAFKEDERLNVLTKRPVTPSKSEVDLNPRSRSAKLRVAEKVT